MSDLTTLSDEELMAQWTAAGDAVAAAQEVAKSFYDEHNRRLTEAAAQAQYDSMSEPERAALQQMFEVQGIASQESVSTSDTPAEAPAPDAVPADVTDGSVQ